MNDPREIKINDAILELNQSSVVDFFDVQNLDLALFLDYLSHSEKLSAREVEVLRAAIASLRKDKGTAAS